jgi:BlaI family penicillinase repressor
MIKNENIGEEKIMKTRLTKSEFAVMEVLWDEGEELTSAEIIQKSKEKEWKDSSVHLLINSLLKKKVVTVAGFKKTTKNYARTFVPVEGKEQFLVGQVIDNKITSDAKKRIYSYIIEKENNPEMIKYVEKLLEERKKELGVKSK